MMLKIAHRGASGHAPENSLAAFGLALEMGIGGVELDIHLCKTGEIVVIHDETLERTTDGKGRVADKSLHALKELLIGDDQRIPTLEEVLDFIDDRAMLIIETKVSGIAKPLGELLESAVHSGKWRRENLVVSSFDLDELREIKKLFPKIPLAPAFDKIKPLKETYAKIAGLSPYSLNIRLDKLDEGTVREIHSYGTKVLAWTVNEPAEIAQAKSLGIDGIISDFPERI